MEQEASYQKETASNAEERLKSKALYKIELYLIKVIPVLLAGICVFNTVLSYYDIDWPILSYIGGISILPLLFLYISSYVFRFCSYHRMFLHYISLNWVLDIVDYYWGIPVSDKEMFMIYWIITGIFLFFILYLHQKEKGKCKS